MSKFKEGDRVVHHYTEVEYTVIKNIDDIFVRCHVNSVPYILQDIMAPGEEYNVCVDQLISAGEYHEDEAINDISTSEEDNQLKEELK